MACPFRHLFGVPGEGVHAHRTFGLASVDLGLTLLGALLIAWARSRGARQFATASIAWFGLLMIVAFVAHVAVGVDTALTVHLRGHPSACAAAAADQNCVA